MNYKSLVLLLLLAGLACANRCINNHCHKQEGDCRADALALPCHTIVNTCLDYCSNGQDYACISLCVSGRKNAPATQLVKCCSEFRCAVERFTALPAGNLSGEIVQDQ